MQEIMQKCMANASTREPKILLSQLEEQKVLENFI